MVQILEKAIQACRPDRDGKRSYFVGAAGIRSNDGVVVTSRNGSCRQRCSGAHAEIRVLRKIGNGSVVGVARIRRDGSIGLARPCSQCMAAMQARGVKKCVWTISNNEFGTMVFS